MPLSSARISNLCLFRVCEKHRFIHYFVCHCDAGTLQNGVFFNISNWSEMLKQILSILYHILHESLLSQLHFYIKPTARSNHESIADVNALAILRFSRYVPVADVTSSNNEHKNDSF